MTTTDLAIPERTELAQLSSAELYKLEVLGDISKEILDERVTQWTEEGWSQRKIADEVGCTGPAISKRQTRLRQEGKITREPDPRGGDRFANRVSKTGEAIEPDEVLEPTSASKHFSVPDMSRKGYIMSLTDLIQDMKQFPSPWNMSDEYKRQISDAVKYLLSL